MALWTLSIATVFSTVPFLGGEGGGVAWRNREGYLSSGLIQKHPSRLTQETENILQERSEACLQP